jgi:hypothetical protein
VHEVFDGDPQPVVGLKDPIKASFEEGLRLQNNGVASSFLTDLRTFKMPNKGN